MTVPYEGVSLPRDDGNEFFDHAGYLAEYQRLRHLSQQETSALLSQAFAEQVALWHPRSDRKPLVMAFVYPHRDRLADDIGEIIEVGGLYVPPAALQDHIVSLMGSHALAYHYRLGEELEHDVRELVGVETDGMFAQRTTLDVSGDTPCVYDYGHLFGHTTNPVIKSQVEQDFGVEIRRTRDI